MFPTKQHFDFKNTYNLKVEGGKKYIPCNWRPKKNGSGYTYIGQNRL